MVSTTQAAVAHGIKTTAGVVTSAAIVMVGVFSIFGVLQAMIFKQFGVGLAAAILIDATLDPCRPPARLHEPAGPRGTGTCPDGSSGSPRFEHGHYEPDEAYPPRTRAAARPIRQRATIWEEKLSPTTPPARTGATTSSRSPVDLGPDAREGGSSPHGRRARDRERTIVVVCVAVLVVHVLDDNFMQPEPGTAAGDHLASGLIPVLLRGATAAAYPHLRAGVRAVALSYCWVMIRQDRMQLTGMVQAVAGVVAGFAIGIVAALLGVAGGELLNSRCSWCCSVLISSWREACRLRSACRQ